MPDRELGAGPGRLLTGVYAVFALAATGRATYQVIAGFAKAPLAYTLSALAALIYVLATVALVKGGDRWRKIATVAISVTLSAEVLVAITALSASKGAAVVTTVASVGPYTLKNSQALAHRATRSSGQASPPLHTDFSEGTCAGSMVASTDGVIAACVTPPSAIVAANAGPA